MDEPPSETLDEAIAERRKRWNELRLFVFLRWLGGFMGAYLVVASIIRLSTDGRFAEPAQWLRFVLVFSLGVLLTLPWRRIPKGRPFVMLMTGLCLTTAAFAFVNVVEVIFEYMRLVEEGIEPGLPAFEGTLIFFAFLQIPSVLFLRNPRMLD